MGDMFGKTVYLDKIKELHDRGVLKGLDVGKDGYLQSITVEGEGDLRDYFRGFSDDVYFLDFKIVKDFKELLKMGSVGHIEFRKGHKVNSLEVDGLLNLVLRNYGGKVIRRVIVKSDPGNLLYAVVFSNYYCRSFDVTLVFRAECYEGVMGILKNSKTVSQVCKAISLLYTPKDYGIFKYRHNKID